MTNPTYSYDPHSMDYVCQELHTSNLFIENNLADLMREAESKLSQWTGLAQQQYYIHKKQWDANILEMNRILGENTAPALEAMLDRMQQTEVKNQSMW
jgi:WXG100 family type VII secretion target